MIAVVEDDEIGSVGVGTAAENVGIHCFAFASAEAFLRSGRMREARCIIADIRMPGMSSLDLQSRLNDEGYPISIIFITAHGDEKMRVRTMRAGAAAFLAKPFEREVLLERVRACMELT